MIMPIALKFDPVSLLTFRSEGQQGDGRQSQGKGSHERRSARNQEVGKEMMCLSTWGDEPMMIFCGIPIPILISRAMHAATSEQSLKHGSS